MPGGLSYASGAESVLRSQSVRHWRGSNHGFPADHARPDRGEPDGVHAAAARGGALSRRGRSLRVRPAHPGRHRPQDADWTLETEQRLLQPATRARVAGLLGGPEPFESVKAAVRAGTLTRSSSRRSPTGMSKRLRRDLPRRVESLGVPITVITPERARLRDNVSNFGGAACKFRSKDRRPSGHTRDSDRPDGTRWSRCIRTPGRLDLARRPALESASSAASVSNFVFR